MVHRDVYKWFENIFPNVAGCRVTAWFPNGRNSIRLRCIDEPELIFTIVDDMTWCLETIKSMEKRRKEEKTNERSH